MNIINLINEGSKILKKNSIFTPLLDSEILMSKVIEKDKRYIIQNFDEKLDKVKIDLYKNLINERSKGKPIAYMLGKKNFWKYSFQVSKDVLIPRPDTEIVVENVLRFCKNRSKLNILDIGIGSGCILLSILKERIDFYGTGIDLSKKCLEISKINAFNLGINNRVKFFKTDIDNFNYGKYDLIVSNPPYINKLELKYLERDVIGFEPILALDGGLDGLSEIRKVILKSSKLIKKNGKLILEIAYNQKNKVKKLLEDKGFYINNILKDYAKNDRCIISTKI